MTYIINPIWFYLIGVASNLSCTFIVISTVIFIIAFVVLLITAMECGGDIEDIMAVVKKFKIKGFIVIAIISLVLGNILPSRETCYQMLTASAFTYENVDYAIETGKDIVDYILETAEDVMDLSADDGSKEE